MISKNEFDCFIKKNLVDVIGNDCFGYEIEDKSYDVYYNKKAYNKFISDMKTSKYNKFYNQYNHGKGSELKEKRNMPPKMASVASSSRFCYLALRDGYKQFNNSEDIIFEHSCRIKGVNATANLDAYIPKANIYFEVKCHEIFSQHSIYLKKSYWNLLYGQENDFGFSYAKCPDIDEFKIELCNFGIAKTKIKFDIKQFLCHLWGIASQKDKDVSAKLVYLFFKPKMDLETERIQVEKVFEELQAEIKNIFSSKPMQIFISNNNIELSAIAEYAKVMEPLSKDNTIILTKLEFKEIRKNLCRRADKKSIITSKQRRKNYRKNLIILSI